MRHIRGAAAFVPAVVLLGALAGCGTPFFISQQNLADVLGKEYLYTGVAAGVDAYDIDWGTGRITKLAGSPFGGGCIGALAASPSGTYLYTTPYISNEVYGFRIEQGGTLVLLPGFPFVPAQTSARAMAFGPDGRFAHIIHSTTVGALTSYSLDAQTGSLASLGSTLGVGCSPLAAVVDPSSSFLYVSNGAPSRIQSYPVGGGLPGTPGVVATPPVAPWQFALHPSGSYLYTVNAGTSDQNIAAYRIDAGTGALASVNGSPFRLGFGPTNLSASSVAVDGWGTFLYATASDDMLYQYRIDGGTGALSLAQGLGSANGGRIGVSDSGRYVFVAGDDNTGAGIIHIYQVASDGSLSEIAGSPFPQTDGRISDVRVVNSHRLP